MPEITHRELRRLKRIEKSNRLLKIIIILLVIAIAFLILHPAEITAADVTYPAPLLTPTPAQAYTPADVDLLARTIYGEARGLPENEQRLVAWTVINRLERGGWGATIEAVVTAPGQFVGYSAGNPIQEAHWRLSLEVLQQWERGEVAPVLPPYATSSGYVYFNERGGKNYFREAF